MLNLDQLVTRCGRVKELELDDDLQGHLLERGSYSKHEVTRREIVEVHAGTPRYFENLGTGRRAPVSMVGPTRRSRIPCVPVQPTHRHGTWRPVTAFETNTHHVERYNAAGGGA